MAMAYGNGLMVTCIKAVPNFCRLLACLVPWWETQALRRLWGACTCSALTLLNHDGLLPAVHCSDKDNFPEPQALSTLTTSGSALSLSCGQPPVSKPQQSEQHMVGDRCGDNYPCGLLCLRGSLPATLMC